MKRWIHASEIHELEITLVIEPSYEPSIAAANKVSHPLSIKKKYKYTDQELADFNDLVNSVCSVINYYNFDIVKERQSKKSYSYYIDFFPTDEEGNKWNDSIQIIFRLANHQNKGVNNQQTAEEVIDNIPRSVVKSYAKSFFVGSKQYPGQFAVMNAVEDICKQLKIGNYSVLDNY